MGLAQVTRYFVFSRFFQSHPLRATAEILERSERRIGQNRRRVVLRVPRYDSLLYWFEIYSEFNGVEYVFFFFLLLNLKFIRCLDFLFRVNIYLKTYKFILNEIIKQSYVSLF